MDMDRPETDGRRIVRQVIGGKSVAASSGSEIDVVCPSDGLVFASIPASGAEDVDRAVHAAASAFETGPWPRMPAVERGRLLTRLCHLVEKNGDELAALESRDTGKPARQGKADVAATLRYYEFYGGAADKIHGDTLPFLDGYTALTLREPHGVLAASFRGIIRCRFWPALRAPRLQWATRWSSSRRKMLR